MNGSKVEEEDALQNWRRVHKRIHGDIISFGVDDSGHVILQKLPILLIVSSTELCKNISAKF